MQFLSRFVAIHLLFILPQYAAATEFMQPSIAAPFGVEVGANGSCDALLKRLGSPPLKQLSGADSSHFSFEAKSPDALFPRAKSISVSCQNGLAWIVTIIVNRSRPSEQELSDVLNRLAEKYGGDARLDPEGYQYFKSQNAQIEVAAKPKTSWFMVRYAYRADYLEERDQAAKSLQQSKQRQDAL